MSNARPILRLPADDEGYKDLRACLIWATDLQLTDAQRAEIKALCFRLVGSTETAPEHRVPLIELLNERKKRQEADKRITELEHELAQLRAERAAPKRWWQFQLQK